MVRKERKGDLCTCEPWVLGLQGLSQMFHALQKKERALVAAGV